MKARSLAAILLATLLFGGCAAEPATDADWESLVAAERDFAHDAATQGTRAAFLAHLADAAIVFRPAPRPGRAFYTAQPEDSSALAWAPAFAARSADGTLGYTTGPWTFTAPGAETPAAHGHYVSLWQRPPGGPWRVVLDVGTSHAPTGPFPTVATGPLAAPRPARTPASIDQLFALDDTLATLTRPDSGLFGAVGGENVRLYLPGHPPAVGRDAARAGLGTLPGRWTWHPEGGHLAPSGDLGYTYGRTDRVPAPEDARPATSYSYLHIWEKAPDAPWHLALVLLNERPVATP